MSFLTVMRSVRTALLILYLSLVRVSAQTNCSCGSAAFERRSCDANYEAQCSLLTQCIPQFEYESAAPTVTTDRKCSTCRVCDGVTTYTSQMCTTTDNTVCSPIVPCASDRFEIYPGGVTHNRACAECRQCALFEYQTTACSQTSDTVCNRTHVCVPGFYESLAPTTTSDRGCTACNACNGPDEYTQSR